MFDSIRILNIKASKYFCVILFEICHTSGEAGKPGCWLPSPRFPSLHVISSRFRDLHIHRSISQFQQDSYLQTKFLSNFEIGREKFAWDQNFCSR